MLLAFHVVAIGIWIGCILTEGVMEASRDNSLAHHKAIANIHTKIDKFIEGPALVAVLITGVILFGQGDQPQMIKIKAAIGLLAIALNAVCIYLIRKRDRLFVAGDDEQAIKAGKLQDAVGGLMILCIITAIVLGFMYSN